MEQVRRDVATFRNLADEVRFYAAHTDPTAGWNPPVVTIEQGNLERPVGQHGSGRWGGFPQYPPRVP